MTEGGPNISVSSSISVIIQFVPSDYNSDRWSNNLEVVQGSKDILVVVSFSLSTVTAQTNR